MLRTSALWVFGKKKHSGIMHKAFYTRITRNFVLHPRFVGLKSVPLRPVKLLVMLPPVCTALRLNIPRLESSRPDQECGGVEGEQDAQGLADLAPRYGLRKKIMPCLQMIGEQILAVSLEKRYPFHDQVHKEHG